MSNGYKMYQATNDIINLNFWAWWLTLGLPAIESSYVQVCNSCENSLYSTLLVAYLVGLGYCEQYTTSSSHSLPSGTQVRSPAAALLIELHNTLLCFWIACEALFAAICCVRFCAKHQQFVASFIDGTQCSLMAAGSLGAVNCSEWDVFVEGIFL